ncbi:MAG TPA: bifunctional phosphopantothenoylcysteine decarboxylase/phosphopantothenate--cysteine ligase CoaBC [Bacteroidia bacterium]|nr:bifunctional phosphopantothenoylcysteine decarboxylase/phosphopantothenate--cysteine ligase CoaBC [Bacteroidia bacterium]
MFAGKKIVLGVSGSIAAYKAVFLLRLLVKDGAEVKVIMTPSARDFVTPLTFSVLSHNPVLIEFSAPDGTWNNHVDMANWADMIILAPASANTIGKMALGLCDNLLLATVFSASCPVYIAPAMDREMYQADSIKKNIALLAKQGRLIIPSEDGELASGLYGEGRMAEPEHIIRFIQENELKGLPLFGKKALVTAGPTYEAIDPVRFIGNHSSGKMGFAIAEELARKGASVTLIHGPVNISTSNSAIKTIGITSAQEMYDECVKAFTGKDITIMSAAVADYKPASPAKEKIKKTGNSLNIELIQNPDILSELGKRKKADQLLIGFALETNDEIKNATAKLKKKNLDAIILNSMQTKGAGPHGDTNKITIIDRQNKTIGFELKPKSLVATDIVNYISACLKK